MMITIPGYRLLDLLIEHHSWSLYKAYSIKNHEIVSIKRRNNERNSTIETAEAIHEFHVMKALESNYLLRPLTIEKYGKEIYIITEPFSGDTLKNRIAKEGPLELRHFLNIAARIAGIVAMIHENHIIHKSLQTQNILYDQQTDELKLTGFEQSTKLSRERQHAHVSPYQIKDRVAYMSPEQTGRMNTSLDYRTDLYALGVIFYELLTGKLPFQANHPAELIHAHLAKVPLKLSILHHNMPEPVSDLIMKLLEKTPESRYQSAFGLQQDLEHCIHLLNQTGEIKAFKLQEADHATVFERPSKLYGRDVAIKQLVDGVNRIGKGVAELILITGPSGIGKTALVNELNKPLIQMKGYFVLGKFMQAKSQIPYAPIVHAFQSLLRQILSEGSERTEKWTKELTAELGVYSSVLAKLIPELEWFTGTPDNVTELDPEAAHHRFRNAIRKFVRVFAKKEHPLVLFIDDLQWADPATIDLIHYLLHSSETENLLIIGAYRDNEIQVGHPFEIMLKNMKKEELKVTKISVEPLQLDHVEKWVEETLFLKGNDAVFLAEMVYRISNGNPFYMIQLFQSLHDEKILHFHHEQAKWLVNHALLKQIPVSETIIDMILKRMQKLSKETIEILQLAACYGNTFNLKDLTTITGKSYKTIANSLWDGLEEGIILPLDESYKWIYPDENSAFLQEHPPTYYFIHDKAQQAFYRSMPEDKRITSHFKIGLELIESDHQVQREEQVFNVAFHWNQCQQRLTAKQKLSLVNWNWKAGEKSRKRAAPTSALHYFSAGKKLLPEDDWAKHYHTTFKIMIGLGEAQYLNLQFDDAERTFDEIISAAKTSRDKLQVYHLKIMLYTHIHEVKRATNAGLDGLRLLGLDIKQTPKKWEVAREYLLTKRALHKKKKLDLLDLPEVSADGPRLMMQTMINTNSPAYHVNQNLATILMLRALRLTLKYGDMDVTALVFNNYALTLSAGFDDYEGSYQFGKLAIAHAEKYQDNSLIARVYFVFGSFVNHWKDHLRYNLDYLERSQVLSIESGNLHLAGANASFIGITLFIKGDHLQDVSAGIKRQLQFARQNAFVLPNSYLEEMLNWITVLTTLNKEVNWDFPVLTDDDSTVIIHYTMRLQMTYLFQHEAKAAEIMGKLASLVDDTLVLVIAPDYYFYDALWTARLVRSGKMSVRNGRRSMLKKLAKLKKWAAHSPKNYLHKSLLVQGELSRAAGKGEEAIQLYNQAIDLAEENGFLQDAAIGNACAASYYMEKKLPKSAKTYVADTYQAYLNWGADRLAYDLSKSYPELATDKQGLLASTMERESLDINAIFEAATAVSDEMNLHQLLRKLMDIAVTNAGAEHAYLLLNQKNKLYLAATNDLNKSMVIYEQPKALNEKMGFSPAIVHYTVNTKEAVVLDHAAEKGKFTRDKFVMMEKAKSILCLPILYQGRLTGVLYLDNNQVPAIFTEERLILLTWLASQAATSIENAYLYRNLETKVTERTALLNKANQELTEANRSLADSKETRRQLLVNISHDLRSPIATIQGYVDAILEGLVESPAEQKDYLQVVKKRLTSLNGLVQDLFDLAQLESGKTSFSLEIIALDQLFTHLCSQYHLEMKQTGIRYSWNMPEYEEADYPLVAVDVKRMEQVMNNLVGNAMNYTKEGEISISLTLDNPREAIIAVEDQGSGIPASELPHVFDRFYTKRNKRKEKGHGLGLAISKEIITAHHGRIWVESEVGTGTKFTFSLQLF